MGRHRFLSFLLVSLLIALHSAHGRERKISESVVHEFSEVGEGARKLREIAEIMDYSDPQPNTNTNGGYIPSLP